MKYRISCMLQKMSLAVVRGKRCQHVGLCAGLSDFGYPQPTDQYDCRHLPLLQCIAIAFQMFVLSISFVVLMSSDVLLIN